MKRELLNWMRLDKKTIVLMSADDWKHYSSGGCLCGAYSEDECCCGAWDKDGPDDEPSIDWADELRREEECIMTYTPLNEADNADVDEPMAKFTVIGPQRILEPMARNLI